MKKEIKKLHEEMGAYRESVKYLTDNALKILEFQIRIVEIVKQIIEKTERLNKSKGKQKL